MNESPEPGKNDGWPVITYGIDYDGQPIGEGTAKAGMEQPVYYWDPVIAPSGMSFYTGDRFPDWEGKHPHWIIKAWIACTFNS